MNEALVDRKAQAWKEDEPFRRHTEEQIAYYAAGGPRSIDDRIRHLDSEWDLERSLEAGGNVLALAGLLLGITHNKKWFLVSGMIAALLLQRSLTGSRVAAMILHRLGVRARHEIAEERMALKALRGDFTPLPSFTEGRDAGAARTLLDMVRR